jgi:hypothetical protein
MTIDDYKLKLIEKILHSQSDTQTLRFIRVALKCLEEKKVNAHIILRFVAKLINDLEPIAIMQDSTEAMNSRVAIQELLGIRKQLTASPQ